MRSINIQKQSGFSLLELALVLSVLTILVIQFIPLNNKITETKIENYAITGLFDIAEAAKSYYADEDETWYRTWPADVATLASTGYLQGFNNGNGFGFPYTIAVDAGTGGLTITTTVDNAVSARTIATNYGPLASATGSTITVGVIIPGNETSHDMLVQIEGDTMVGDLIFNDLPADGQSANIEMGDNQILNARQIDSVIFDARPGDGTGNVTADSMETDFISADDFRYTTP